MEMENVSCPLCGSWKHRLLFRRRDHTHQVSDVEFGIVKCRDCGFVFVNPRPTQEGIHEYYPDDFYSVDITPKKLLAESATRNEAKLKLIRHLPPGRLLDIGCQKGEFLYEARELGWQVEGLEFSTKPPNLFQLPIHYGTLETAPYEDASFDLITIWAVLEHVHDPLLMLSHVRRLLKPNGRALVLVPNFNSIPGRLMHHDDVPRHLVMFTPRTFKKMARKADLNVVRIIFSDEVFSGSTRGLLNFLYKRMRGERLSDIIAQNREPGRWTEFSNCIHGEKNDFMLKIDRLDVAINPYIDRLVNWLGFGFTMTIEIQPENHPVTAQRNIK